jgi:hypothetical protein
VLSHKKRYSPHKPSNASKTALQHIPIQRLSTASAAHLLDVFRDLWSLMFKLGLWDRGAESKIRARGHLLVMQQVRVYLAYIRQEK